MGRKVGETAGYMMEGLIREGFRDKIILEYDETKPFDGHEECPAR